MYTNINSALGALMERRNMTLGIDNLINLLSELDNPQLDLKCIHIAGTNGKGSTSNYVRSGLQAAGNKVGSFTSPHLVVHNDRIRINNENISDEVFLRYINDSIQYWEPYSLSMFEIDMFISIMYFRDEAVDYVVYEVGLGGRLDATNVIHPLVCAVTNIGYDHMGILGNTLEEIAGEKAGIFKPGVPVFTTEKNDSVLNVFNEKTDLLNIVEIPQHTVGDKSYSYTLDGIEITLTNQGIYQISNSALALKILKYLNIADESIKSGIENTSWAGRFEEISQGVYLDGAHNSMGIENLIKSMEILPKPWVVVFTALADKSHSEMVDRLEAVFDEVIITEFEFYRAAKAQDLALNHKVTIETDYKKAIQIGKDHRQSGTLIITGSLYFISEAREYLLLK